MVTFEEIGIKSELMRGIEELGFDSPMPIQERVIPTLLKNEQDILGFAQTGTGKTAAFGLPIIQRIDLLNENPQTLILSPTRELCLQIANDLNNYSKHIRGLNIVTVYGGADIVNQMRALKRGAHIIVATPGRMNDLLNRRHIIDLSEIETVVLDEADEMLSMGFREELDAILDRTPDTKTTLLFSATMSKDVKKLATKYMRDPIEISVGERNVGAEKVKHLCYNVHEKDRYLALKRIVDYIPNIYGIIFCRTREETKEVARKLIQDGYNADALHGDLSQAQRESVMHKFRLKNLHLLTATDVAARGLDVKDITHIINYNLPDDTITYIHRSGRTGRAGHNGISIAITNLREKYKIADIEKLLKKKFELKQVPTGKEVCEKRVLNIVDRLRTIEVDHEEIEKFLPAVNKKLESLSREDLIKHFVAMEFNRFLEYYKDADELSPPRERERGEFRKPKTNRNKRAGYSRLIPETGFTRFYINLGEKDKITPPDLLGLVNRSTRQRNVEVGRIDIMRKFSFFEVDEYFAKALLAGFKNITLNKKKVIVEISSGEGNFEPSSYNGNGNGRGNGKRKNLNYKKKQRVN
ncbi:MAG: DEAD/DEAH box helicase [bacterium]|nr:DEAD/DEAH box helicase [bacterium]